MCIVSEEQERLFSENAPKLIRWVIKNHKDTIKYYDSYEDMEQILLLKAWKAMPNYDESKGKLSTYIATVCTNSIRQTIRLAKAQKRKEQIKRISLNQEIGEGLTLEDIVGNGEDVDEYLEEQKLVDEITGMLSRESYAYFIDGMSQIDIARITGKSQTYISRLIKKNILQIKAAMYRRSL